MARKYIAELVGTFGLTFGVTCAVVAHSLQKDPSLVGVALALGGIVAVLVYALGRVSGAHFNPAVTFGLALAKKIKPPEAAAYWLSQCAGAVLASLLLKAIFPDSTTLGETLPAGTAVQSLLMEIALTFFLLLVVLRIEVGPPGLALLSGLAVGLVLAMDVIVGGATSGASMNPARSLGPALVLMKFDHFWIYVVGPLAGAAVAVVVDRLLEGQKAEA
jgi:aquaporin Z